MNEHHEQQLQEKLVHEKNEYKFQLIGSKENEDQIEIFLDL